MKRLTSLLEDLNKAKIKYRVFGQKDIDVTNIYDDSRKVKKGGLFVAIKGLRSDGHNFVDQAIKNKAAVVVVERIPKSYKGEVTVVKVNDTRSALAILSSSWFGNPSKKLKVIGITGTDGKTTTATLISQILNNNSKKCGLITTVNVQIGKKSYDTGRLTTPGALSIQSFLSKMVKAGCRYAVIEVSSHATDQKRVQGVDFEIGVLTNVTKWEHSDYHGGFRLYRDAKAELLKKSKKVVLNKDDVFYTFFLSKYKDRKVISYGIEKNADFKVSSVRLKSTGTQFLINKEYKIDSRLLGVFNVYNLVAAISASRILGISWEGILRSIHFIRPPEGRLDAFKNNKNINIFIDYAHTPNGLESCLSTLRSIYPDKRIIALVGAEGGRDVIKRQLMGAVSTKYADYTIFTSVDPGLEKEENILKDLEKGATGGYISIPDRGEAIAEAIQNIARRSDVVVICGKGHERYIDYKGVDYYWSDREAVRIALRGEVYALGKIYN